MPYTPQDSARNILAQTGDQSAQLAIGRSLSGNVASNIPSTDYDPNQQFGLALMGLLQQAQGLGTAGFQKAGFAGQQEQINRTLSTPQDLIGASPQLQASVRGASVSAVEPTITGAQNLQKTFGEQLGSLKDAIYYADQLSFRHEQQLQKAKDDAEKQFHDLLGTQGSSFLDALSPEQKKDWEKRLGYPSGLLNHLGRTIKEQELVAKQQTDLQNENIKQQNLLLSKQRFGLEEQRRSLEEQRPGTKSTKNLSPSQFKTKAIQDMAEHLNSVRGSDNFVSPVDYRRFRQLWTSVTGLSGSEFDKAFKQYANPYDPNGLAAYGLTSPKSTKPQTQLPILKKK